MACIQILEIETGTLPAFGINDVPRKLDSSGMDIDFILDENRFRLEENLSFKKTSLICLKLNVGKGLFLFGDCHTARLDDQHGAMGVRELNLSRSLTDILENNFFLMLLATLHKPQVNKRFKHNLALGLIHANRQLSQGALVT